MIGARERGMWWFRFWPLGPGLWWRNRNRHPMLHVLRSRTKPYHLWAGVGPYAFGLFLPQRRKP